MHLLHIACVCCGGISWIFRRTNAQSSKEWALWCEGKESCCLWLVLFLDTYPIWHRQDFWGSQLEASSPDRYPQPSAHSSRRHPWLTTQPPTQNSWPTRSERDALRAGRTLVWQDAVTEYTHARTKSKHRQWPWLWRSFDCFSLTRISLRWEKYAWQGTLLYFTYRRHSTPRG